MKTSPAIPSTNRVLSTADRIKFIPYRGKKLFMMDFSNCSLEETTVLIDEARKIIVTQPPKSLLSYTDLTNATATPEVVKEFRDFAKDNALYVKAGVVVGLNGLMRMVVDAVNRFTQREIRVFDDPVKAKNWLVNK